MRLKDYVDAIVFDLRAYVDTQHESVEAQINRRVENLRREAAARADAARLAVEKSEAAIDRRLEAMNEFRAQLAEQAGTFITRETAAKDQLIVRERVENLERWRASVIGRALGLAVVWTIFVAVSSALAVHLVT